jgi:D-sedoheptulose 7-phosphate isomerase
VNFEKAELHVAASLREGADLRLEVAGYCGRQIVEAALLISDCLAAGEKLLLFGNGGSAADAQHLAAEFVGRFVVERPGLAAIALTLIPPFLPRWQMTTALSGYSLDNLRRWAGQATWPSASAQAAMKQAANQNLKTIGLSGKDGGLLARASDVSVTVPAANTARIQECHIAIGHIWCELVEFDRISSSWSRRRTNLDLGANADATDGAWDLLAVTRPRSL